MLSEDVVKSLRNISELLKSAAEDLPNSYEKSASLVLGSSEKAILGEAYCQTKLNAYLSGIENGVNKR